MARILTSATLREMFASETDACPVFLVTITHPSLSEPIQLSTDPTERIEETPSDVAYGTKSRGNDFIFFPFQLTLPSDEDEGPQNMSFTFDNVTRKYVEILRSISGPPVVTTEFVMAGRPDIVEATWLEFLLTEAKYNQVTITGTLTLETLFREPFPALSFSPGYFPALY